MQDGEGRGRVEYDCHHALDEKVQLWDEIAIEIAILPTCLFAFGAAASR